MPGRHHHEGHEAVSTPRPNTTAAFDVQLVALMPRLLNFARKLTARSQIDPEDLLQDTIERALQRRHLYDANTGTLAAWAGTMMKNLFLGDMRAASVKRPHVEFTEQHVRPKQPEAEVRLELRDARRAINSLPGGERIVFEEAVLKGKTWEQAAQDLRIPIGTIKSRLDRARKKVVEAARP